MGEDKKDPNKTKHIRELISMVFNGTVITQRQGTCMSYPKSEFILKPKLYQMKFFMHNIVIKKRSACIIFMLCCFKLRKLWTLEMFPAIL